MGLLNIKVRTKNKFFRAFTAKGRFCKLNGIPLERGLTYNKMYTFK